MISTHDIKTQQLANGFFQTGTGTEKVLIMGSCRVAPYVFYLDHWNKTVGENRFTIYSLDPFNWHFHSTTNEMVDLHAAIDAMEKHEGLLTMLRSVDTLIHEWYANYGMFNTFKDDGVKSIYDFCSPKKDICLPNYNDVFVLFNDHYKFDKEFAKQADEDYANFGKLTRITQSYIKNKSLANLEKFYDVCGKSSLSAVGRVFKNHCHFDRFFHNFNHVSSNFTILIFHELLITNNLLNIKTPTEFWDEISKFDMFDSDRTPLTEYDVENFGFHWGEPVVSFKEYNNIKV